MPKYDYDMFTIGAGSGGVASSRRAGSYGARIAICEESRVGGTCVIRGCVPKKLLVHGAQFADAFDDAVGFGWAAHKPKFDWPTLIANKDAEIDRLNGLYKKMLADSGVALFEAHGTIVDPHTVEVAGKHHTAAHILIATGSHPTVPAIPGIEHAITSNEAMYLPTLPRKLIIVGGGYIAVEFAGIFAGLGTEVVQLIRGDDLLKGFDDDVRVCLAMEMRNRGVEIRTRMNVVKIEKFSHGITATTAHGEEISADAILYATGRRPNTRNLGLDAVGVKIGEDGAIVVDERSETSVKGIYAVGDVTNNLNLTPVAIAEGRALAETLFNDNPMIVDHNNVPTAVFSQPPVGTVGLSEHDARKKYGAVDIYRTRFKPMKNILADRDERTMMKLVVDRATDRVLGCHMVGADAPEIIQGLAIALNCGATKKQFDRTIGLHPSAAEEFVTLRDRVPEPKAAAAE